MSNTIDGVALVEKLDGMRTWQALDDNPVLDTLHAPPACACPISWMGIVHVEWCQHHVEAPLAPNVWGITRADAERHIPHTRAELNEKHKHMSDRMARPDKDGSWFGTYTAKRAHAGAPTEWPRIKTSQYVHEGSVFFVDEKGRVVKVGGN